MAKKKKAATNKKTVPGYAGIAEDTLEGTPPEAKTEMPEGTVIGQGGTISKPTEVVPSIAFHKSVTKEKRFAGKCLIEGDTFHGYHYKMIVELTEALTLAGAYNTFRGHHPDAVREGFKVRPLSEDEAKNLVKEWSDEKEGK